MENEDQIQEWLHKILRSKDWDVKREIIPDEARNWNHPYKIDLVVYKSDHNELNPMGIELKYIRGFRKGSIIAKALDQILFKYATNHFNGERLKTIVIGTYYQDYENSKNKSMINTVNIFTKSFLAYWGVGFLDLNDNPLRIQFGADSQNDMKIHIKFDYPNPAYRDSYQKSYKTNPQKILSKSIRWRKLIS